MHGMEKEKRRGRKGRTRRTGKRIGENEKERKHEKVKGGRKR